MPRPKGMETTPVNIRLDSRLVEQVKAISESDGLRISWIVEQAIREWIVRHEETA